jgi:ribulose-5-phosphate 4-epimerase/fuculose-1-phosphate aldolase
MLVERSELEVQLLDGWRRLARKGFLNSSFDSFSIRIPGTGEMLLATGSDDSPAVGRVTLCVKSFIPENQTTTLHESIYLERPDVGAVVISSPNGARLLAKSIGKLPPLFDEQVRHIGPSMRTPLDEKHLSRDRVRKAFARGANAALLSDRLVCLGMTCERAAFNTELFEKCAQACVIAQASGIRPRSIPGWVRLIANQRLMKDERDAAKSYLNGQLPERTTLY